MKRYGWFVLPIVIVGVLLYGSQTEDPQPSRAARIRAVAEDVRCPICRQQSAAESESASAKLIRRSIAEQVDAGKSEEEVKQFLVARYGSDILLTPGSTGAGKLVWALPAVVVVLAAGGLTYAIRRWQRSGAALPKSQGWAWLFGTVLLAGAAGVTLVATSSERVSGDQATGSIEEGVSTWLAQARERTGEEEVLEAIKLYDKVLEVDPKNTEALAYRGWLLVQAQLPDEGLGYIDRAIAADPTYPDAHFFRGFVLWRVKGDPGAAVQEFQQFLANDPPPDMVDAVRSALAEAQADAQTTTTGVP